jgi:midasin
MNPASDIGKKNLPISIRNRFTEVYVDELDEKNDLCLMIREYLNKLNPSSGLINTIVDTYVDVKTKVINQLTNGVGLQPIFSLRTLCRALRYASKNPCNNGILSVYDGMCLSFLTDLNRQSSGILENFIRSKLLSGSKNLNVASIQRVIPTIANYTKSHFQKVDEFWILKGKIII